MLANLDDLIAAAGRVYGSAGISRPFALLEAVDRVGSGEDPAAIAREIRSTRKKVLEVAGSNNPIHAVRVRGFASNYRRAEVDMHFSISDDLVSLAEMLEILRDHGLQGLTARIERGEL